MAHCKCKVESYHLCESFCKRCRCACDGVAPSGARKRQTGNQGEARNKAGRMRRPAAKKTRISIISDLHNGIDDTDIMHGVTPIRTVGGIRHAFEWNRGTRKSLPGESKRKTNTTFQEEGVRAGAVWCKLC